jgi:hypothetical protein
MRNSLEKRKQIKKLSLGVRSFEGPLNPREDKLHEGFMGLTINEYENMQRKHLKAYMRGEEFFFYKNKRYNVEFKLKGEEK